MQKNKIPSLLIFLYDSTLFDIAKMNDVQTRNSITRKMISWNLCGQLWGCFYISRQFRKFKTYRLKTNMKETAKESDISVNFEEVFDDSMIWHNKIAFFMCFGMFYANWSAFNLKRRVWIHLFSIHNCLLFCSLLMSVCDE